MPKEIAVERMHNGQARFYHSLGRRNVLRCGRRWGKSTLFETMGANWALRYGWFVGIFAPEYDKMETIFENLLFKLEPAIRQASKTTKKIQLRNGGTLDFFSLTDPRAGRSKKFHRVLIDEASLAKNATMKDQWEKAIEPALLDYGGHAIAAGTPMGVDPSNWFFQINHNHGVAEPWKVFHAPSSSNPHLPAEELALKERTTHPLVFRQEYLAEFIDWTGVAFFSLDSMTDNGRGVPFPTQCTYVGAVIDTAIKDGAEHDGSAVLYYARSSYGGAPLVFLDWSIEQVRGNLLPQWIPSVFERLTELATQCGAAFGSAGVFIEDKASGSVLLQEGYDQGWPVRAINGDMTSMGKNQRAIAVSGNVFSKEVRMSQYALDKTMKYKGVEQNHLVSQFCGFILNDPQAYKRADDLADCAMYAILTTLKPEI